MRSDQCPVCGMEASESSIELEHTGLHYRFCSEQCRDNFAANPRLYLGKAGKSAGPLLKRRKFMLESALSEEQVETVKRTLFELMGIASVCIDGKRVEVCYDLLQARAAQVEKAIENAGAKLGSGWSARLKRGWLNYTEENELDQLEAEPGACCGRPPAKR